MLIGIGYLRGVQLTIDIQNSLEPKGTFKDFKDKLYKDAKFVERVAALKQEVSAFATQFPIPGLATL